MIIKRNTKKENFFIFALNFNFLKLKKFNKKFKDLEAFLADQISVEIREKGKNKAQIFDFLEEKEIILFQNENEIDLSLSGKIEKEESGKNHTIKNSKETFEILLKEYSDK